MEVPTPPLRERLARLVPILVLAPSLVASFIYVFVFTGWTLYISLSNSTLLPTLRVRRASKNYASLWANRRWGIAYTNLFVFSAFYVVLAMLVGLLLAIADRPAGARRIGLADDLPVSAGGVVHRHRHGLGLALQSRPAVSSSW